MSGALSGLMIEPGRAGTLAEWLGPALASASPSLAGGDETLDGAALARLADEVAAGLARLAPAEPVLVAIGNRPRDLAALLGVWRAGGVAVPLHVATPEAVQAGLQRRTGARLLVDGTKVIRLSGEPPLPRPLLAEAALVVFTSGSTGEPKGVVLGHRQLAGKLHHLARLLRPRPDDLVLLPLQLTFIFGIWVSLLTLAAGARLRLLPRFSPDAARSELASGASILACVPTMLRGLVNAPPVEAPRLRALLTGGEPLPPALAQATAKSLPTGAIFDLYGLTETGSCDFCLHPAQQPAGFGSIGRPTADVEFRLIAPDGTPAAPGATGELQIATPYGMLGYLDRPDLTAASFAGRYFRTGDLARLRPDGFVQLVGRAKEVISRAGHKIAPLELEALLTQHPDVAAALCGGVPDPQVGERVHVVVVSRPGARLDAETLSAWAATRIERYKLPDAIHFRDELPTGRTGKADRGALARQFGPS